MTRQKLFDIINLFINIDKQSNKVDSLLRKTNKKRKRLYIFNSKASM